MLARFRALGLKYWCGSGSNGIWNTNGVATMMRRDEKIWFIMCDLLSDYIRYTLMKLKLVPQA